MSNPRKEDEICLCGHRRGNHRRGRGKCDFCTLPYCGCSRFQNIDRIKSMLPRALEKSNVANLPQCPTRRRKPGRPTILPDAVITSIRISKKQAKAIARAARLARKEKSQWMRDVIDAACRAEEAKE